MNFGISAIFIILYFNPFFATAIDWQSTGWAMSCDFNGNDMSNTPTAADQCGPTCQNTAGCTHFTWTNYQGGMCWMKSGQVSQNNAVVKTDQGAICGIVNSGSNGAAINWQSTGWAMSCDFIGNDLSNKPTAANQCGQTCQNTAGCTHFTWTNSQGGTCWMKSGQVSQNNAVVKTDQGAVCGIVNSGSNGGSGVIITTVNNCPYTIWVGMDGKSRSNPSYIVPNNGGWQLNSGQQTDVTVPKDLDSARIWARTNCNTQSGQFKCDTGDCGPWVDCCNGGVHRGGAPPASLAEFTLNGGGIQDNYDVSLVDGFNLPIKMIPKSANSNPSANSNTWCKTAGCNSNLNDICPGELQNVINGNVVSCDSACLKFNTDNYCCRGAFGQPSTCKSSTWPTNYPAIFKQACPNAYTYAYDDPSSLFFCKDTDYTIEFC